MKLSKKHGNSLVFVQGSEVRVVGFAGATIFNKFVCDGKFIDSVH